MDKTLYLIFAATILLLTSMALASFYTSSIEDSESDLSEMKDSLTPEGWQDTKLKKNQTTHDIDLERGELDWIKL